MGDPIYRPSETPYMPLQAGPGSMGPGSIGPALIADA